MTKALIAEKPGLELPLQPPGLTVQFLRPDEAEELLIRRKVRAVLKSVDELWAPMGRALLVDGYTRRAKKAGWTVVCNAKGVR